MPNRTKTETNALALVPILQTNETKIKKTPYAGQDNAHHHKMLLLEIAVAATVTKTTATLGTQIRIPTPTGTTAIPPETAQTGDLVLAKTGKTGTTGVGSKGKGADRIC